MRKLFGLALLPLALGTCGPFTHSSRTQPAQVPSVETTAAVVDHRIPLGHYIWPGQGGQCGSPYSPEISEPCGEALGVCGNTVTGPRQPILLPDVFRCTDSSATFADVCRERPESQWPWYGLDAGECERFLAAA